MAEQHILCTNRMINIVLSHITQIVASIIENRVWVDVDPNVIYDTLYDVLSKTQFAAISNDGSRFEVCEVVRVDKDHLSFQPIPMHRVMAEDYMAEAKMIIKQSSEYATYKDSLPLDPKSLSMYGLMVDLVDCLYSLYFRIQLRKNAIQIAPDILSWENVKFPTGETLQEFSLRSSLFCNTISDMSSSHIGVMLRSPNGMIETVTLKYRYSVENVPISTHIRNMMGLQKDDRIVPGASMFPQPVLWTVTVSSSSPEAPFGDHSV